MIFTGMGRPSKRIAKQLEAVDAVMRCSTDGEQENAAKTRQHLEML